MNQYVFLTVAVALFAGTTADIIPNENTNINSVSSKVCGPNDVDSRQIKYHFFTREEYLMDQTIENIHKQINESHHHVNKATKIIVHGWNQSLSDPDYKRLALYYLQNQDINLILVDWGVYSIICDVRTSIDHVKPVVSNSLGLLLKALLVRGTNTTTIHIIGWNLGAHIAGSAGKLLHPYMLGRITALDYKTNDYSGPGSLQTGDASFVDVIHTTSQSESKRSKVGHVRFYPNGGNGLQPGCTQATDPLCSSLASLKYYVRTVLVPRAYESRRCQDYDEYLAGRCSKNQINLMGEYADASYPGDYYIKINEVPY